MALALDSREHFLDVIQAPYQARTEIEAGRPERRSALRGSVELSQTGPQRFVHHGLERLTALTRHVLEPRGDVLLQRQGSAHILML